MRDPKKLIEITSSISEIQLHFFDEINDGFEIENVNVRLSTFSRLGIKNAIIKAGSITQCIFEDVYGRRAKFYNVNFTGSIFRNCNFELSTFRSCTLNYCEFSNTQLPYREIISCLPMEPNIREELARNLKTNYLGLGQKDIADVFLDIEIKAKEERMLEIIKSNTSYYKENYTQLDVLKAFFQFLLSKSRRYITGDGYCIKNIVISFFIIIGIYSIILTIINPPFIYSNVNVQSIDLIKACKIVLSETIQYPHIKYSPESMSGKVVLLISRITGILYLGLISATFYRKISR